MSGPVRPPLKVKESDNSVTVLPCQTVNFNAADFTVSKTGTEATISIDSTGTGAALTSTYVGFGDASNLLSGSSKLTWVDTAGSEKLTITGSNTSDTAGTVKIVNTANSALTGPDLLFYHDRGSGNAANGDYLAHFAFTGRNSADAEETYVRMFTRAGTVTNGAEDGSWFMQAMVDGTLRNFMKFQGSGGSGYLTINEDGIDSDFRIECLSTATGIDTTHALKMDGATGNLGLGVGTPTPALHIKRDNTITDMNSSGAAAITIEQDGTGDTALSFLLTGTMRWMLGVDNNDSNKLKFATGGTDLSTGTKVTVDTNGYVGIGDAAPEALLHVKGTSEGADSDVIIESTAALGTNPAPGLILWRNTVGVDEKWLGEIVYKGQDVDGGNHNYVELNSYITHPGSAGNPNVNGMLDLDVMKSGSLVQVARFRETGADFNTGQNAGLDFRVRSDNNASMFLVDAGTERVGVGATPDSTQGWLQVNVGDTSEHALTLISEVVADDDCPTLNFYRKADVADGRYIGEIIFSGYADGTTTQTEYAQITSQMNDDTAGTLDGTISFTALKNNTLWEHLRLGSGSVTVNEASGHIDFRVEADGSDSLLRTSATSESRLGAANTGIVSIGKVADNNQALLQVELDASFYRYVISQKTENYDVTADDMHGGVLTMKAAATGSRTFTLPEVGVIGMHCSFVNYSSNGMDIAVNSSSAHYINNGGSAGNSTTAVYTTLAQRVDVMYVESNQWVATLPPLCVVS